MTCKEYTDFLLQHYNLVSVLSEKNNCKVIRLRNEKTDKDIVLHILKTPLEIYDYLCGIKCDNLPEIYDSLILDDGQAVLEEYIDGVTVEQIMETGKYHYHGVKKVMLSICNALSVLHNKGFVHRDIKPQNVVIDKDGRIVLIDFNTVRKINGAKKDTVIMGTVGFASPEQLGLSESDTRTDIYSLGVLLNVMVTGVHPGQKTAKGRVGRIVRKCTEINPDDRYRTVDKLADAL